MIINDSLIDDVRFTRNPDGSRYHDFKVDGYRFRLYLNKYNDLYTIKLRYTTKNYPSYIIADSKDGRNWDILKDHCESTCGYTYRRNYNSDMYHIAKLMIQAMNSERRVK